MGWRTTGIVLLAAVLFASCSKTSTNTTFIVSTHFQPQENGALFPAEGVRGYCFYVDTSFWYVAGYEDAAAGIITSRTSNDRRMAERGAVADSAGIVVLPNVTGSVAMLVFASPDAEGYAWRGIYVPENVPEFVLPLYFRGWQRDTSYVFGKWNMVYR